MTWQQHGVPASIHDIDPAWLAACLSDRIRPAGVRAAQRIGEAFGLASEVWRIPTGAPFGAVVVKLWDTTTTAGEGEVEFYRRFGADPGIRVPRCHYAAVDTTTDRGVLVLEDLSEARQGDATTTMGPDDRDRVVRAIAGFHVAWWGADAPLDVPPRIHLPSLDDDPSFIAERRSAYEARFGALGDDALGHLLRIAEEVLPSADDVLADAPPTLLHGDLHLDNILFVGPDSEPCFLDWTRTGTGPGVRSVANLAFNMSPPGVCDEVLNTYVDELHRHGIDYDLALARRDLAAATVWAVLVWTLGMVRWHPASPREEAMIDLTRRGAAHACEMWAEAMPGWPATLSDI